jgi:hypothetical protein
MHIPSGKYYAGCKINAKANSSDLMTSTGYKTTSKIVKRLIKTDGLESFKILKIKHFTTADLAIQYETRFLCKVKAADNCKFLNMHNGGRNFVNKGGYKLKESTKIKMSKPKSAITVEKQNMEKINRSDHVYKKMVETRRSNGSSWITDDQREKIKLFNDRYWTDENCELQKHRMLEHYKNHPVSEETKQKIKDKNIGENNAMFGKKHSEATKEKMKLAWKKRKEKKLQINNFNLYERL